MEQLTTGRCDGLDKDAALSRVGGDIDLLREIAGVFLDDCPRSLAELRDATARGEYAALERSAHALKGASATFGANRLVSAAQHIEKMGHGRNLDGIAPALVEVETALKALQGELEALIAS